MGEQNKEYSNKHKENYFTLSNHEFKVRLILLKHAQNGKSSVLQLLSALVFGDIDPLKCLQCGEGNIHIFLHT